MSKLDKERQGKANTISMELENIFYEHNITDKQAFLSDIGAILCQLDTDIAIEVMTNFGEEGKNVIYNIKVYYGY